MMVRNRNESRELTRTQEYEKSFLRALTPFSGSNTKKNVLVLFVSLRKENFVGVALQMDWHAEPFLLFPFSRCFCCLRKIISLWPPPIFKILSNFLFLNDRPVFFSFFFFSLLGCVLLAQPFLPTAFLWSMLQRMATKQEKQPKKNRDKNKKISRLLRNDPPPPPPLQRGA